MEGHGKEIEMKYLKNSNLAELLKSIEKSATDLAESVKMLREIKEFNKIIKKEFNEIELSEDQKNYLIELIRSRKIPRKRASELIDEFKNYPTKRTKWHGITPA